MPYIALDKIHKTGVSIVLIFSLIATIILIYIGGRYAYPVILFWMLIPVFIKKFIDRFKGKGRKG